ncbi:TetR/AcrR family transcriptional regulator [Jannaschia sp. R86511]|uniref:TetR/AcrR family transcriptional regulator n=1 Tax=Jannaschia sp. R86511 TaxID=3093853 RepID=UPI0036D341FB
MAVRVRNPRGEGLRLREELVLAAGRLLESDDPTAVTLRGVAREAGVAAPSVYGHFADLDALLLAVVEHHLARLRREVEAVTGADPEARLRAASLAYCRWGVEHAGAYEVVFGGRALRLLSEQESAAFADGEAMLTHLGDLLAALPGVTAPQVPDLVLAGWTGLHGCVSLRTGKPGYPWPPLPAHVDLVVDGLLGVRG